MSENHISNKKPTYHISNHLTDYLRKYSRELRIPIRYLDLKHHFTKVPLEDKGGFIQLLWRKRFFKVQEYGGGSPSLFGYNI